TIHRVHSPKKEWTRHSIGELLAFYLIARRRLKALHAQIQPDAIISVFTMPAGLLGAAWKQRYGVPYTVVLQGSDVPGYQPKRFALLHPMMQIVARYVWRRAAAVSAVSTPLAELARKTLPSGAFTVIPNGVDTGLFQTDEAPPHPGNDTIHLITVAQLIERKGIQHLIEAIASLPVEMRTRIRADVYGSGPFAASLEKQIQEAGVQEQIALRGLLEDKDLCAKLKAADIFVLPTQQEGLPLALLEGMASGLPCVTTPVGDIPKVMQGELEALLVPPANSDALRDKLQSLIADPERRHHLGAACHTAAQAYDWSAIWKQYEKHTETMVLSETA
ncbi:MAG: glycosyltransferase, partial [Verrucomicrobia bacterium]|nr:glycosyltransferase [Verrucomicrobiota bacterium]